MGRLLLLFALAAAVLAIAKTPDDETGAFELVALNDDGVGFRPSLRREFESKNECENLARGLQLSTMRRWACNRITETP